MKPSVGFISQTCSFIDTSAGVVHTGGVPVAGRPKAKLLNVTGISQAGARPLAMHAAGTPGDVISRVTVGCTPG